uniref:Ig-like domain-containing protein n=1 Tax=Scophthalmus maximus TaxID=52904 RepID=A0A8D3A8N8_SCOMX
MSCEMRVNCVRVSAGLCHGAGVLTVDSLRGAAGESVTFTTSVKPGAEPFLALTWSFNVTYNIITSTRADFVGQGYENRIDLDKSTGSLVLRNLTEGDSGEYELIIIPYGGEQIQGTVKLEVLTCPTGHLIEGKTSVELTCDAGGSVSSRMWMKDGKALVSGDRFSFHDGNRVLSISPVDRRDTGEFFCNVSNDFSFETAKLLNIYIYTVYIYIYYGPDKPTLVQRPVGAELEESVTLSCSAESLPKATFFWTFRHRRFPGPSYYIDEMDEEHLGKYTCTARNAITGLEASEVHMLRVLTKEVSETSTLS